MLTSMNKDMSLEVVTAPERSKTVLANEILGNPDLEGSILLYHHYLQASIEQLLSKEATCLSGHIFQLAGLSGGLAKTFVSAYIVSLPPL